MAPEKEALLEGLEGRVQEAYQSYYPQLESELWELGIYADSLELYLRAFKKQEKLQVWVRNCSDSTLQFFKTYSFCKFSGQLGPKRKEGDKQIPEGFYHISQYIPKSSYYMALELSYPNSADKVLGDLEAPGSDIQIHGDCVSTGCLSITDEKIKELYLLCHKASENGQDYIEVHIFPTDFAIFSALDLIQEEPNYAIHTDLWKSLEQAFCYFERTKKIPDYRITREGGYVILDARPKMGD